LSYAVVSQLLKDTIARLSVMVSRNLFETIAQIPLYRYKFLSGMLPR